MVSDLLERLQAALADRYLIECELGRGGMAIVCLSEDRKHQQRVALKVLRPELAASIGAERFLREIRTAAQLTHPNILPLHDSGEAGGTLYYTMPYVEGDSLRDRLNREHQLPIEDALRITREVADLLGYAHEQGIIHLDIKPENILFQRGHALVADSGIARAVAAAGPETLTETGLAVGTSAYMSPEQGAGAAELDGRSDLYSLGCVLYETLSGEPPYTGPTAQAIIARKLTDPLPPVTTVRETVPAAEQRSPGHPSLLRFRGDLLFARRDFEGAQRYWDSLSNVQSALSEEFVRGRWCQLALVRGQIGEWRTRCDTSPSRPIMRAFLEFRYTGDTAAAAAILEPVLQRSDAPLSPPAWQLELLVITLAEMGRVDLARRFLGAWMREFGEHHPTGRLAGEITLAEGLPDSAVGALHAWYAQRRYVYTTDLPELARAYEQAGHVDSAIVLYERALETPSIYGVEDEMDWYPLVLRRLGELHASLGHRDEAKRYYSEFIDLWKDADPELQPQVEEARDVVARLAAEPRQ